MSTKKQDVHAAFNEAYTLLNAAQKEAVDTTEGPVMVIAGPGTGKTQILTLRIANILMQTDTAPESILALTFTESGAKAMRERLRRYIGPEAYRVPIYTFHGFAQKLIKEYPDAYDRVIGGRPASDLEKINLIEAILDGGEIKLLRPMGNPSYYVYHILRMFGQLKQEYITPDGFMKIIDHQETELQGIEKVHEKGAHKGKVRGEYTKKEKSIAKNHELLYIYRQYEALLSEQGLYDFEDMIVETVKALTDNEDMLRDLQETHQYVLADEHQDVNGSQNKILKLLCSYHESPNIFVVGDEKQAIYRFQGASLENFLYFEDAFKNTKTIALDKNYRSGQVVLDAAHSLVAVEDGPLAALRIPLSAEAVDSSQVTQRCFSHQAVEDTWMVAEIASEIKNGTLLEEIAVIVRTNREVEAMAAALRKEGIAVTASADGDILRHPMTHAVQGLINAVIADKDESALFAVLHGTYWGISINDLVKIASARSYGTGLVSILTDADKLQELGVSDVDAALRVCRVLAEARKKEVHEAPHRVLEYVLQESGFLDHLMEHDSFEGVRVVRRLYDEIEELVLRDGVGTLREVSAMFATRLSYGLPLNAPYIATDTQSVQVMTAHKSKGLEFAVVFAPHLGDGLWGGGTRKTYFDVPLTKHLNETEFDALDDERRLLYVLMTRAKRMLHLSCSDTNADGKELSPTRLFDDIDEEYLSPEETTEAEKQFDPAKTLIQKKGEITVDAQLLTHLLTERGFSATSLNNYLRSPWDYFYRNVLRIPETQPVHMQFGTAVHNVMEKCTKHHTDKGTMPSDTKIKELLEIELARMPVTKEEYVRLHEKGLEALYTYIVHTKETLPKNTKEELSVRVVLQTGIPELPELPLTGKLDRLDIGEDGIAYQVVDYKTGKPKTRNVIEGKTASSDGVYKRQLVFYALLLSLYDDDRYRCNTGVLSFVEADAKGVIHEEVFTITNQEVEDLKEEIIAVAKDIISGEFLTSRCEEGDSDYYHLVQMLQR
jgi:DNA helicase-2/ATP-dependent DNA helicase PcrA